MTALALKRALNKLNLTPVQAAKKLDVSPSCVSRWLNGKRGIRGPAAAAIRGWLRHGL
jgi:predicted transcriptional regulator